MPIHGTRPLVIAYHLVWTVYGWWLPNDPRGSMSRYIAAETIAELGSIHHGRKRVQPASREIRVFYEQAEKVLKFPLLQFTREDTNAVATGISKAIDENRYTCYACEIMPDHVHVLIRKHRHSAEEMIAVMQERARRSLRELGLRAPDHPVWGGPGWKVFLDCPEDIRRSIRYVRENPLKQRLSAQKWAFVTEYDDWPLHPGHNPNSPYARRLRGRI